MKWKRRIWWCCILALVYVFFPSKRQNDPFETSLWASRNENGNGKIEKLIPDGYKLQNVPGDGLCGYWAVLTAKNAKEGNGKSIKVSRGEVKELLKRLSDRIAYTIKKEDKTEIEMEMVCEIDQLIRDNYARDYEDLCKKVEKGSMQLDSPLSLFLAPEIGYNIVLKLERKKNGKVINDTNFYDSGDAAAQGIMIYYSGNGSGGHYQAIIPVAVKVDYIYS